MLIKHQGFIIKLLTITPIHFYTASSFRGRQSLLSRVYQYSKAKKDLGNSIIPFE
jgi:hypothetical protein